jgi:hypothetical protein
MAQEIVKCLLLKTRGLNVTDRKDLSGVDIHGRYNVSKVLQKRMKRAETQNDGGEDSIHSS